MNPRCLVIVICQTRGYRSTWEPFKRNVLDTLGADLAVCVSTSQISDPFREHAKYRWEYPDYSDWAQAYSDVSRELGSTVDWRPILGVGAGTGCLFGGINIPARSTYHGSGAVLFYYRWRVHESIRNLNLTEKYDWFIITRSDYMYDVPHVPVSMLDPNFAWSPNGERYGGITDRHLICPSRYILDATSMLHCMLTTPHEFVRIFQSYGGETNPESCIMSYFQAKNIPVRFVPYFMYVVRELDEVRNPTYIYNPPSHISYQSYRGNPYGIKYAEEKRSADELHIQTPADWARYIERPSGT
jgi:hypothetical protein